METRVNLQKEDDGDVEWTKYWDAISGQPLSMEKVEGARREEVEYIRKSWLYNLVPGGECWRVTGKRLIPGKWLDLNKGDLEREIYRSRGVA